MNTKNRKRTSVVMGVAAAALLTAGSLAFFTDRQQGTFSATAGTLGLELTQNWATDNTDVAGALIPGKKLELDYTLANTGNKSMDVKEQIVITSPVAMSGAQAEFELYAANDVEQDSTTGAWKPKAEAQPVATRSLSRDGLKVTYEIPEFILNGTGENAETEDSVTATSKTGDYVIVFRDTAANAFQGQTISIDYLAQAKQHRNTGSDTWTTVATDTITFAGNDSFQAVPEA